MFVKSGVYEWICDCGDNRFTIEYHNQRKRIYGKILLRFVKMKHEIGFYKFGKSIEKTMGFMTIFDDTIEEDIIDLFNQQIIAHYEHGGEKYRQSEMWIEKN